MNLETYLREAVEQKASDIFILPGRPLTFKVNNRFFDITPEKLTPEQTKNFVKAIYNMAEVSLFQEFSTDDDLAIMIPGVSRFRVNVFRQRFTLGAIIRVVKMTIPTPEEVNVPQAIINMSNLSRGIVLVTGTTGSGKSTTLACVIDKINVTRDCHIVTLEEPIEYRHDHKKAIVTQREIGADTPDYKTALKSVMRQTPDVILVGEMRDHETISTAISAAETGHLVFSTLHTLGAANTIERIIDVFPSTQQNQIRTQLALTLQAIISQQLIPTADGNLHPVFEILTVNTVVKNLIREGKTYQINNIITTSNNEGMIDMDTSILSVFKRKLITKKNALMYAFNSAEMAKRIDMIK